MRPANVKGVRSTTNLPNPMRVVWDERGPRAVVGAKRYPVALRGPGLEGVEGTQCYSTGTAGDFGPKGPRLRPGEYLVLAERPCRSTPSSPKPSVEAP